MLAETSKAIGGYAYLAVYRPDISQLSVISVIVDSGHIEWNVSLRSSSGCEGVVHHAPVSLEHARSTLIVDPCGSGSRDLYLVDAESGRVTGTVTRPDGSSLRVVEGRLIMESPEQGGRLRAFDAATGRELWDVPYDIDLNELVTSTNWASHQNRPGWAWEDPAVAWHLVVLELDGVWRFASTIDLATGTGRGERWPIGTMETGVSLVYNGKLYAHAPDGDNRLQVRAFDLDRSSTKQPQWTWTAGAEFDSHHTRVAVCGLIRVCVVDHRHLTILDATTGRRVGRHETSGRIGRVDTVGEHILIRPWGDEPDATSTILDPDGANPAILPGTAYRLNKDTALVRFRPTAFTPFAVELTAVQVTPPHQTTLGTVTVRGCSWNDTHLTCLHEVEPETWRMTIWRFR